MSKTSQDHQIPGHNEEGRNTPWILVVEAKCNLIDSVGVGHDQVEAILQRKGKEGTSMVGKPAGLPLANLFHNLVLCSLGLTYEAEEVVHP